MKTLLAVAFALPLGALAQPARNDGEATEVSELVIKARKATELSDLEVKGGCKVPDQDSQWPKTWFDAPPDAKGKRTEESTGTRAFILKLIAGIREGHPDYAHMGDQLAGETSRKLKLSTLWIVCRGAFKDIKFLHVSQQGYDDFEVDFSNGALEWEAQPLDAREVEQQTAIRFYYPQPQTRQLLDLLVSMLNGRPDYAGVTPEFASTLRAQWPSLQASLRAWAPLDPLYFLRLGDDGSYIFSTGSKHGKVIWRLAPLDGAGKITGLTFDAPPD